MQISLRQFGFILIFLSLQFLTLFFAETHFRFILIGIFALFFLTQLKNLDFTEFYKRKGLFLLWVVFLLILFIGLPFSQSIHLSLPQIAGYLFAFLIYTFILLLKPHFFSIQLFIDGLKILGFILGGISLFFLVSPQLAGLLPGMNIFYPTYGHSQLGSYFLFIYPLILLSALDSKSHLNKLMALIAVGFILLSLSRITIVLALIQSLVVFIIQKRHQIKIRINVLALSLFFLGMIVVLFFSFFPENSPLCPDGFFKKICKPLSLEVRPYYFQQAIQATLNRPIFGYGIGTFTLISNQLKQTPFAYSAYAHNAFLQILAEAGVFAGVMFIILILRIIFPAILHIFKSDVQNSKDRMLFGLSLGIVTAIGEVLVDYDWSFLGFFILFLTIAALIEKERYFLPVINQINLRATSLMKFTFIFFLLLLIALGLINVATEILLFQKKTVEIVRFFPYFHTQKHFIFEDVKNYPLEDKVLTDKIYAMDPDYYQSALDNDYDYVSRNEALQFLSIYDPWNIDRRLENLALLREQSNFDEWKKEALGLVTLVKNSETNYQYFLHENSSKLIAEELLNGADKLLFSSEEVTAGELYLHAYQIEPWSINFHEMSGFTIDKTVHWSAFVEPLITIPTDNFGNNRTVIAEMLLQSILETKMDSSKNLNQKLEEKMNKLENLDPEVAQKLK